MKNISILILYFIILSCSKETNENYKKDNDSVKIPIADFNISKKLIKVGDSVQLIDLSKHNPTQWRWSLGNGDWINNIQYPKYKYNTVGVFDILLTVENQYGSDWVSKKGAIIVSSLSGDCMGCDSGIVSDIDGNTYKTIKIGNQWWMAENLRTTTFQNGEKIPHVTNNYEWKELSTPAYCWLNNDSINARKYGCFYNWYTISSKNVCPIGWHVPTDSSWLMLELNLGMSVEVSKETQWRGLDEGNKLKIVDTTYWQHVGSTNESGFSALSLGNRDAYSGRFSFYGTDASWWTSSESTINSAWSRSISDLYYNISRGTTSKKTGYSIRCIKD